MAGFEYAGSLVGPHAPIVRKGLHTSETMYVGQLCMSGITAGTGGHVQIADVAGEAQEDGFKIFGLVSGVVDGSRAYNSTYFGDSTTYTTTQATVAAYGPSEVEVTLIIPGITLVKGPIFNGAFGTALTEVVATSASSGGTTITSTSNAVTDIADSYTTAYCRSGANRGQYRIITNCGTGANVATVPFKYGIAVGDKFVIAGCILGTGWMYLGATANYIDGNNTMTNYYYVYYHTVNLEESGKEFAVFSLWNGAHSHT